MKKMLAKYFYFAMSLLIAFAVLFGFSHTTGKRLVHANPVPPVLLWFHAALFVGWLFFFIVQSGVVRIRKVQWHRVLGWFGVAMAVSMVVLGVWVAIVMARFDMAHHLSDNSDAFLIVPFTDMLSFGLLTALAIVYRNKPELHRRYILLATCALTGAGFARLPYAFMTVGFTYVCQDGLMCLGALRDLILMKKVHPIYLWAIPLLIVEHVAIVHVVHARWEPWMRVAHWILR